MPSDWGTQLQVAQKEMQAEMDAQQQLVQASVYAIGEIASAHVGISQNNYYTDTDIGIREANVRASAAQLGSQAQLAATSIPFSICPQSL